MQELLRPEMFDVVAGQIHLHDVGGQVGRDVAQTCRENGRESSLQLSR